MIAFLRLEFADSDEVPRYSEMMSPPKSLCAVRNNASLSTLQCVLKSYYITVFDPTVLKPPETHFAKYG